MIKSYVEQYQNGDLWLTPSKISKDTSTPIEVVNQEIKSYRYGKVKNIALAEELVQEGDLTLFEIAQRAQISFDEVIGAHAAVRIRKGQPFLQGEEIKDIRESLCITVNDITEYLNISKSLWYRYEKGTSDAHNEHIWFLLKLQSLVKIDGLPGFDSLSEPLQSALSRCLMGETLMDGSSLKSIRKRLNMTLAEAANVADVAYPTYCAYEGGRLTIPDNIRDIFKQMDDDGNLFKPFKVYSKYTRYDLRLIRKFFNLSMSEACLLIGNVKQGTWQQWESGTCKIPDTVDNTINKILHGWRTSDYDGLHHIITSKIEDTRNNINTINNLSDGLKQ